LVENLDPKQLVAAEATAIAMMGTIATTLERTGVLSKEKP